MILVVGATGVLGQQVCRALRERGAPVRALVRGPSPASAELAKAGVALVTGDLKDRASLRSAVDRVEAVVSTATAISHRASGDSLQTVDRGGQLALIEAARSAGVRRFVYVSVSPNFLPDCELLTNKRLVERELRGSGLEWVVLQPPAFQEIWLSPILGWDFAAGKARVVGSGEKRVSFVAIPDVARVAAEAATRPEFVRRDVPFGGPEDLAPNDVVRLAEEVTGRKFRVQRIPTGVFRVVRGALAPFAPVAASLLSLNIQVAEKGDVLDSSELWRSLGHTPRKVRDYIAAAAGAR